ncbi:hypothetical protein ACFL5O_03330 [Myxococcota bacterium]
MAAIRSPTERLAVACRAAAGAQIAVAMPAVACPVGEEVMNGGANQVAAIYWVGAGVSVDVAQCPAAVGLSVARPTMDGQMPKPATFPAGEEVMNDGATQIAVTCLAVAEEPKNGPTPAVGAYLTAVVQAQSEAKLGLSAYPEQAEAPNVQPAGLVGRVSMLRDRPASRTDDSIRAVTRTAVVAGGRVVHRMRRRNRENEPRPDRQRPALTPARCAAPRSAGTRDHQLGYPLDCWPDRSRGLPDAQWR